MELGLSKRPFTAPDFGYERQVSNYGHMNEWIKTKNQPKPIVPETFRASGLSDRPMTRPGLPVYADGSSHFYTPVDNEDTDQNRRAPMPNSEKYLQMYRDMSDRIAYRYPNPGVPKARSGRMGASWRHVRQVQQHVGIPILYVDGRVKVHDHDKMNTTMAKCALERPHVRTPLYCPNRHDVTPNNRDNIGWPWSHPSRPAIPCIMYSSSGACEYTTHYNTRHAVGPTAPIDISYMTTHQTIEIISAGPTPVIETIGKDEPMALPKDPNPALCFQ